MRYFIQSLLYSELQEANNSNSVLGQNNVNTSIIWHFIWWTRLRDMPFPGEVQTGAFGFYFRAVKCLSILYWCKCNFFFIELDITTLRRILYLFSLVSEVCTESLKGAGVPSSIWWNLVVHVYRIPSVDWKWNRCIWEHLFGIKQVLTYFEKRGLIFLLSVQCYYWKNKITILLGITFGCIYWHWVLKLGFHIMDFLQNWLLNTIYRFICIEHFKFRIG